MLAMVAKVRHARECRRQSCRPRRTIPFDDQLAAVIEARPALFSFTFGIPNADALRAPAPCRHPHLRHGDDSRGGARSASGGRGVDCRAGRGGWRPSRRFPRRHRSIDGADARLDARHCCRRFVAGLCLRRPDGWRRHQTCARHRRGRRATRHRVSGLPGKRRCRAVQAGAAGCAAGHHGDYPRPIPAERRAVCATSSST